MQREKDQQNMVSNISVIIKQTSVIISLVRRGKTQANHVMGIEQNCFFFSTFTIVCNADAFVIRAAVLRLNVRKTRAIHRNVADDGLDAASTVRRTTNERHRKTVRPKDKSGLKKAHTRTQAPPRRPTPLVHAHPGRGRQSTCSKVTAQGVVTAPARQEVMTAAVRVMMVRRRRR